MMSKILKAASGATDQLRQQTIEETLASVERQPNLAVPNAYGRRSALAAEAAARWEALERETEELRQSLNAAEASIAVLTQSSEALKTEIASLRFDNERLVRENTTIQTRVTIAAETLLAIRRPSPEVEEATVSAVEAAMNESVSHSEPEPSVEHKTGDWK